MSSGKRISIFTDRELMLIHSSLVSVHLIAQQQDEGEVPEGFIEAIQEVLKKVFTALELREQEINEFEAIIEQSLQDVLQLTPAIIAEETEQ